MRSAALAVLLTGFVSLGIVPAQANDAAPGIGALHTASDFSAQRRERRARRARLRIDVRPAPLLYRDCVAWLATERRPSGIVIIPRERCRWVRG
jgi:hypothetical protein